MRINREVWNVGVSSILLLLLNAAWIAAMDLT
eukprot:sb/3479786/